MLRIACLLCCACSVADADEVAIKMSTEPRTPLVEVTRAGQALNFDVFIQHSGRTPLELVAFEMTVRDDRGRMVMQRRLGQNGNTIEVITNRELPAGGHLLVFNPLPLWPTDVELRNVEVAVTLSDAEGEHSQESKVTVQPHVYVPKHSAHLPLDGLVFVHAGHDLNDHHRRFPLHSQMADALKVEHNVTRYAYDFALANETGQLHRGDGSKLTDWFGYGAAVLAPAAGTIVETHDGQPDNDIGQPPRLDREELTRNAKLLFGHYVLIDHGNGEFSMLAHLKMNSVAVQAGTRVKANQKLAAMGMSGDASIVHLHYQAQSAPGFSEGVPTRFVSFARNTGERWVQTDAGQIETGEIVRDTSRKPN